MKHGIITSIVLAGTMVAGCAKDHEMEGLQQTLPIASIAGSAYTLAETIEESVNASTAASEADKADLLARAAVLKAHAERVSDAIRLHDPALGSKQAITLANLHARGEALEDEYRATFREWGYWQVRHGIKTPDEIFEVFDYAEALK